MNSILLFFLKKHFHAQVLRVENLVDVYDILLKLNRKTSRKNNTDVLRAAVVFLHATLEDALREVAREKIPESSAELLNQYPLLGTDSRSRKTTFGLGDLKKFEDEQVGKLINRSINEFLNRESFNSTDDICNLFRKIGVDPALFKSHYPEIQKMIERRHHIVHQTDKRERYVAYIGPHPAKALTRSQVVRWTKVVSKFVDEVLAQFNTNSQHHPPAQK